MTGFLVDHATIVKHLRLTHHLKAHCLLYRAQGVDILGLGAGTKLGGADRAQGHVGVHAHRTLVHAGIGNAECRDQLAQSGDIGTRNLRSTLAGAFNRLGHNLNQRNTSAVAVNQ